MGGCLFEKLCVLIINLPRNTNVVPLPVLLICTKCPGHHANLHGRESCTSRFAKCVQTFMKFHNRPLWASVF